MVSRSDISGGEFHEVFGSRHECLSAAFDQGAARISQLIEEAARCEHGWRDRVRAALLAVLVFLDEQPGWARLLIGDQSVDAGLASERRERALRALARTLIAEMQAEANNAGWFVPWAELTGELVVGGIVSVLRARICEETRQPLVDLAPSLMAFITPHYSGSRSSVDPERTEADDAEPLYLRLPLRVTYRTTRVLHAIDTSPGLSNRDIAEAAGLTDEGQTSRLLRRLEERGLVQNVGLGHAYGGANAWLLTEYGDRVLRATRHSLVPGSGAITGRRVRGAT